MKIAANQAKSDGKSDGEILGMYTSGGNIGKDVTSLPPAPWPLVSFLQPQVQQGEDVEGKQQPQHAPIR